MLNVLLRATVNAQQAWCPVHLLHLSCHMYPFMSKLNVNDNDVEFAITGT